MKRYKGEEFNNLAIAKVESLAESGIVFTLTPAEIKHIRRCLYIRRLNFPDLEFDKGSLTPILTRKFDIFGELTPQRKRGEAIRNAKLNKICEYEGCGSIDNIEAHHIKKISSGGTNEKENIKYLCTKHHDLLELEWILKRKESEIIKIKQKIDLIKNPNTVTTLSEKQATPTDL